MKLLFSFLFVLFSQACLSPGEMLFRYSENVIVAKTPIELHPKKEFPSTPLKVPQHSIRPNKPINTGIAWFSDHSVDFIPQLSKLVYTVPAINYFSPQTPLPSNKSPPHFFL